MKPIRLYLVHFFKPVLYPQGGHGLKEENQPSESGSGTSRFSSIFIMNSLPSACRLVLEHFEMYRLSSVIEHYPDGTFNNLGEIPFPTPIINLLKHRKPMMNDVKKIYIKEIKDHMKTIRESLKCISESAKAQDLATNVKDYTSAQLASKDACISIMQSLEEMVHLASSLGCSFDLYEPRTIHEVVERKL